MMLRVRNLHPFRHRAITLVEVLAALVLLGGTATTLLIAHTQALLQLRQARDREQAHRLADELIITWQQTNERIERDGQGSIEWTNEHQESTARMASRWSWTRNVRRVRPTPDTEMSEVAVTIYLERSTDPPDAFATVTWLTPVIDSLDPDVP